MTIRFVEFRSLTMPKVTFHVNPEHVVYVARNSGSAAGTIIQVAFMETDLLTDEAYYDVVNKLRGLQ